MTNFSLLTGPRAADIGIGADFGAFIKASCGSGKAESKSTKSNSTWKDEIASLAQETRHSGRLS